MGLDGDNSCARHKLGLKNLIYHYTSLSSLLSLVTGVDEDMKIFNFHATHAAFLNDPSENKLIMSTLTDLGVKESLIELCDGLGGTPYIISFCNTENNLSMWRLYGNKASGIALGFDENNIINYYKTNGIMSLVIHEKCKYTTLPQLKRTIKDSKDYQEWKSSLSIREDLLPIARIMMNSLMYKYKSYEYEDEFRLGFKDVVSKEFRINAKGLLIPYKSMPIPVSSLKSIAIGPSADFDKTKFSINKLLQTKNCLSRVEENCEVDSFIHQTNIPYSNIY